MKMTPEYLKAQENMHAGIISSSGFLGSDSRLISDIISNDEELVQALGMNFTEITNRLKFFMEKALGPKKRLWVRLFLTQPWVLIKIF